MTKTKIFHTKATGIFKRAANADKKSFIIAKQQIQYLDISLFAFLGVKKYNR